MKNQQSQRVIIKQSLQWNCGTPFNLAQQNKYSGLNGIRTQIIVMQEWAELPELLDFEKDSFRK